MTSRRVIVVLAALMLMLHGQLLAVSAGQASTSASVVTTTTVEASFPQGITFTATVPLPASNADVDAAQLLYRIASNPTLNLDILSPTEFSVADGAVNASVLLDLQSVFVPVGVDLAFYWEVLLADGTVIETAEEVTQWTDTRFDWEVRTTEQLRLYSYGASDGFADRMLSESQATVDRLETQYELDEIPIQTIWVYETYDDFAGALQSNSREAVAAFSLQGYDTIIAVVPDGDDAEFGRVIPHEISHQVTYAATSEAFDMPPLWFDEGMATHTQIGGTSGYGEVVATALADGTLFDIQSLDTSFPYQPQQATLAYACSWSVVVYIETTWGAEGIARLIDAFGTELPADDAVQHALGVTIDELNDGWKAWIAANPPAD